MRQCVQVYEHILARVRSDEYPAFYSTIQNDLGLTYHKLPTQNPTPNLTRAIRCYQEALRFFIPETHLRKYASIRNSLGIAYIDLPATDPTPHLMQAIDCFQETLRFFLPQVDPLLYAIIQMNLGKAHYQLPTGDRRHNLKSTIHCCQEALRFIIPKTDPLEYAGVQNILGNAYMDLPDEDRTDNILLAIECFQEALRFLTPKTHPVEYGGILSNLGHAYYELPQGSRANNLAQALHHCQEALRFVTANNSPFVYSNIQNNLGAISLNLPTGDQSANLSQAICCFQEALRFITPQNNPLAYAGTQNNLGNTYCELPTGNRGSNLERAIAYYQEALRFRTATKAPPVYAETQVNLANAYYWLPTGDRMGNLTRAIKCIEEALRIYTPETTPLSYAMAQNNLGSIYLALPAVNKVASHEQAIQCFLEALRFRTPQNDPLKYAETQNNLGMVYHRQAITYRNLSDEYRTEKLTQAVHCFQEALRFWTAQAYPLRYGELQNNLGNTYADMPAKDTSSHLTQVIGYYEEALRFLTPQVNPTKYAVIQNNLGIAYNKLRTGDLRSNMQRAMQCFQEALRFQTPDAEPYAYRITTRNLADLYFAQGAWNTALQFYYNAMSAGEQLYQASLSTRSRAAEQHENASLYTNAAFAAARCGDATEAMLILEHGKTRLLTETLRLRVPRPPHVPDDIWKKFERASERLHAEQGEEGFEDERLDPIQIYQNRSKNAQEASEAFNAAVESVRVHVPHFLDARDLSNAETQFADQRTALISFCITEQGSMGFVMSQHAPEQLQVVEIPAFTQTDLRRLLQDSDQQPASGWLSDYDRYLIDKTNAHMQLWQNTITHVLTELGTHILGPLLSTLSPDIERLVLLPAAGLFLFPLHAVPLPGGDLLCDKYEVSYAPSLEVRAHGAASITRTQEPGLYALINPAENASLPFASSEGTAIGHFFAQPQLDRGPAGTKERVLAGMQTQTYIHFACHGSYDWDDPSFSGLLLANEQRLTLADLQYHAINLSHVRLVTLSACETGITDTMRNSAAEYVGIPAGFLLAGVPCVIGSLWSVPDISTALLMEHFYYQHLHNGMSIAAALREAQRWIRHLNAEAIADYAVKWYRLADQRDPNKRKLHEQMTYYRGRADEHPIQCLFAHPYYWAAFTVNGI